MRWLSCLPLFIRKKFIRNSAVFIPNQEFSLPWPIMFYICSNGSLFIQLKLFSTCQQLKNVISKIRGYQVDKIVFKFGRDYKWNKQLKTNKIKTDNKIIVLIWCKKLKFKKPLKMKYLVVDVNFSRGKAVLPFFAKLDFSILESAEIVNIHGFTFDIDVLRPILVSSLIELKINTVLKLENGDLLKIALTELPNLKVLEMRWQDGITNLSDAALISRATKLDHLEIDWIYENLTPQIISNFIIKQMSNSSVTALFVMRQGAHFVCRCYQKEIRDVISEKLENAKFQFGVLYTCSHK